MKTYNEIITHLNSLHEKPFNFNPAKIEQGTDEWAFMKLGVISASNITAVLAGEKTATRNTYMCNLIAQIITKESPSVSAKPLEWGIENEISARAAYEFATGKKVKDLPFVYGDETMRYGFSPDGYGEEKPFGLELKCPYTSSVFVDFKCNGKIKPEYIKQCRFSAWVAGLDSWEFANFDPRVTTDNFHMVTVEQCPKFVKEIEEKLPKFISDMDVMLKELGIKFGFQWK